MRPAARRRTSVLAAALAVTLLAACGGTADDPDEPEPVVQTETPEEPVDEPEPDDTEDADADGDPGDVAPEADEEQTFEGGTALDEAEPAGDFALTVSDVRVGTHADFDRVVFDLEGTGTPGWWVQYVDEALDAGSGDPVPVSGDSFLEVIIVGTGMPMDTGIDEYDGTPVRLDGESVSEVVYRFVFEGQSTAFIGVDGEPKPFRVFRLEDPTRVVVDVGH